MGYLWDRCLGCIEQLRCSFAEGTPCSHPSSHRPQAPRWIRYRNVIPISVACSHKLQQSQELNLALEFQSGAFYHFLLSHEHLHFWPLGRRGGGRKRKKRFINVHICTWAFGFETSLKSLSSCYLCKLQRVRGKAHPENQNLNSPNIWTES